MIDRCVVDTMISPSDLDRFSNQAKGNGSLELNNHETLCHPSHRRAARATEPIREFKGDAQPLEQKQAFGSRYLGEAIAAHLQQPAHLPVRTAALPEADQGFEDATLDQPDERT